MGDYYTVAEVAEMISVKPRTVQQWINKGKMKAYKFGDLWRIKKTDFDEFVAQASNQPKKNGKKQES